MKRITIFLIFFGLFSLGFCQSNIVGYEFWFDNQYETRQIITVPATNQLTIDETISTGVLSPGTHLFHFRTFDQAGKISPINTTFFYKRSSSESDTIPTLTSYEYWFNNDFENRTTINTTPQQVYNIDTILNMSTLSNGVQALNLRFKGNSGLWSSVYKHFFYKKPEQLIPLNYITEVRYWINTDVNGAISIPFDPNFQVTILDSINLSNLNKGFYDIHFQFKDTNGIWSMVIKETIEKLSLPIAYFTYILDQTCDSTAVTFTNLSIDGDLYFWDFGDGNTSEQSEPIHCYFSPGSYDVSLTVTDTTLNIDSTIIQTITINSLDSYSTILETACFTYTAPDGAIYTTSGVKNAIIPNFMGCDSIITINLTIDTVDLTIIPNDTSLTAMASNASFQWLDCNNNYSIIIGENNASFYPAINGAYAVEISQNNCIDTSDCYPISSIGIHEVTNSLHASLIPNPNNGTFKIFFNQSIPDLQLYITDVHGKRVYQNEYTDQDEIYLNMDVEPGLYFIIIISGTKRSILKFVVI